MATKRPSTLAPRIAPFALPELVDLHVSELRAHDRFDAGRLSTDDMSGLDLAGITFAECELLDLTAHETILRDLTLVESVVRRLNAPVFVAPRSSLRDVVIDSSRLGSAELYESDWQSVTLTGSKLGYVNLRGARLRDVLFVDCTIDELDVSEATATRVAFTGCDITTLETTRATLEHVDLREARLSRVIGLAGLRGATLSDLQVTELAPAFAEHLGVRVE